MRLLIAEKPSVARDLARVLGCTHREQGFFRGKGLLVSWAVGHLVRLAEPGEIQPAWGKPWRREALPMLPTRWPLVPEPRTQDQLEVLLRLMRAATTKTLINATDAGREGEAIFRRILAVAQVDKPVLRFWTSSLTDEAITEAYARLRPAAEYDALGAAAQTRAQLDWLIGMNHSRATTLHNGLLCSIGRVQTPTLAMIVRRHREITGFIKTFFHEVHADLGDFIVRALNPEGRHDFDRKPEAEAILAAAAPGATATVTFAEIKPRRIPPPQLHNLGELQKEANRRFGLSADRTLAAAQSLYEKKVLTYPRSSSRHLPEEMAGSLPRVLAALQVGADRAELLAVALRRAKHGPPLGKRYLDDTKLSDHHAIIPTGKAAPAGLSGEERHIYTLVAERFLAIWLPDKQVEETRVDVAIGEHPFRARGSRLLEPGWTALFGGTGSAGADPKAEAEDRQALPPVRVGEIRTVLDSELVTKERKPPARYSDATLLAAMETAGREIDDEAMREAMRGRGLGTEATRAAILEKLLQQEYIVREGKALEPTAKGLALVELLEGALPHLLSPELTGDMEARLGEVEAGRLDPAALLAETAQGLRRDVPVLFQSKPMQPLPAFSRPPAKAAGRATSPNAAANGAANAPARAKAAKGTAKPGTGRKAAGKRKTGASAKRRVAKDPALEPAAAASAVDLLCPRCGAPLELRPGSGERESFYGCSQGQGLCGFTLGTVYARHRLTPSELQALCSGRHRTGLIRGFISKAGRPFNAVLWLNPDNHLRCEFEFER